MVVRRRCGSVARALGFRVCVLGQLGEPATRPKEEEVVVLWEPYLIIGGVCGVLMLLSCGIYLLAAKPKCGKKR